MMTPDMLEVSKLTLTTPLAAAVDGRCIGLVCQFKSVDFWPRVKS